MTTRSTIVIKLPEQVNAKRARVLLRQLKPALRLDQPAVVLDLSDVRQMDTAGLDMLLHCMVEVANHDGSLKLAGISPEAATVLELTRMDRLFDMFPSVAEAVSIAKAEAPALAPAPDDIAPAAVAA